MEQGQPDALELAVSHVQKVHIKNTHLKFSNSYIQMYRSRRLLAVQRRLF